MRFARNVERLSYDWVRWCCFGLIFYPPSRCISLSSICPCWNCFHVVDFQLVTLGESTRVSGISPQTASMAFSYTHTHRTRHIIRLSLRSSQSIPPHLFASLPYLSLLFFPQHARNGATKTRNKTNDKGGGGDFPSHQIRAVCAPLWFTAAAFLDGPPVIVWLVLQALYDLDFIIKSRNIFLFARLRLLHQTTQSSSLSVYNTENNSALVWRRSTQRDVTSTREFTAQVSKVDR